MFTRIYNFILDYIEYILLVVLLGIASFFILSNENPDVRSLQAEISSVIRFIHYPAKWLNTLSGLVDENIQLTQENIQLKLLNVNFKETFLENRRLNKMLGFMDSVSIEIIPVKVLNKGVTPIYNSLLLDGGQNIGILPYCAVITNQGVIGKTISVGPKTTVVHLLNDVNFRMGIRLQNSRHSGILEPMTDRAGLIKEIPKTTPVSVGEEVITSGYSDIFPKGFPVGKVVEIQEIKNSIYKNAVIKFNVNINTVEEVFVIKK
ncbi:MAG: rod shape-determining protein MreC [Candidatus Marinimicrobia bacterium]|nr:rod shape-determining protein MreC [Candidatus Neomarinimicrobiota bacterium]